MNIYQKLQAMRVRLQGMNIKKSGENKFAGYKYYELGDFMPPINKLMEEFGVCSFIRYEEEQATLTLVNSDKVDEIITFTSPMKEAVLKGAHPIQNLGAVETYQRRYLYMTAFEIVEADILDATQGSDQEKPKQKAKPQLSESTSKLLNDKIAEVRMNTGYKTGEITNLLARKGFSIKDVTEKNAKQVLAALDEISEEYMEAENEL